MFTVPLLTAMIAFLLGVKKYMGSLYPYEAKTQIVVYFHNEKCYFYFQGPHGLPGPKVN